MKTFSKINEIINSPVWRKEPDSTLNYLCAKLDCHRTCSRDDSIVSALILLTVQPLPCAQCDHSHWSHFHSRSKWEKKQEPRETVDETTTKWEAIVAKSKRELDRLNGEVDEGLAELERLA